MKTAKRVLAVIVAVIMIAGTCAVAASAATLQSLIDAAPAGSTVTMPTNTVETVTINKNLTLDLNGYRLRGVDGQAAIKITAGDVTVTNGQVLSRIDPGMKSEDMLKIVGKNSPAAIRITGGKLTVDGVRLVGGMVRVPTTPVNDPLLVPSGSGIMSYNGAEVTIKRSSIYGDYGVNNNVKGSTPGAKPVIEDAIILAYTRAIKGTNANDFQDNYIVPDTSEEIIAADRITGILNGGIRLEPKEKEIVGNVLNERTLIVVKTPDELTAMNNAALNGDLDPENENYVDTTPTITVTQGKSTADVVAPVLDYTWPNTKGTDCSYKMVPEGVLMPGGYVVDLDRVDATEPLDDCQIVYRVEYKIGDEAKEYMDYIISDDPAVNKLDGCLGWAGLELDEYYAKFTEKNTNGYVDTYDELVDELGDLMWTIDNGGATEIPGTGGKTLAELPEFLTLRQKLYALAGVTAYNASDARKANEGYVDFDAVTYSNLFNGAEMPANGIVGTLDRVDALKKQLEEKRGSSFTKTQNWDEIAIWLVDTVYPELVEKDDSILNEAIEKLEDLKTTLETDPYDKIVNAFNLGGSNSPVSLLSEGIANAKKIQKVINDALKNNDVKSTVDYIKANKAEIKELVETGVRVINNWRDYVTPSKFLVENNTFVKTFTMKGSQITDEKESTGKLHITVSGTGSVAFSNGTEFNGATDEHIDVGFEDQFTLTATPEDDTVEFLFWANREGGGNYILSTEPTFTMTTNAERFIEAVFNDKSDRTVYFTNPTGDICGNTTVFDTNGNAVVSNVRRPSIAGYGFGGWAGVDNDLVLAQNLDKSANIAALTDYAKGNSAFAEYGVFYGADGAVLLINPDSSSYIVTPKYSTTGSYTVTFYDAGEVYTANGTYSDKITMTSNLDGAAYWVIKGTNKVVSVNSSMEYIIIDNMEFESVAGTYDKVAATYTIVKEQDGMVNFYMARSTNKAIATTGFVFVKDPQPTIDPETGDSIPFNPETDLVLYGEGVSKGTSKSTDGTGLFAPAFNIQNLNGKPLYVRPFIEFKDGTVFHGDVVPYNV